MPTTQIGQHLPLTKVEVTRNRSEKIDQQLNNNGYLVVEPTQFEKYAQVKLDHFPKERGENSKNSWNHHTVTENHMLSHISILADENKTL